MKKYKIVKTFAGYFLAVCLSSGIINQISPLFPSVGLLADWLDNYNENIIITK